MRRLVSASMLAIDPWKTGGSGDGLVGGEGGTDDCVGVDGVAATGVEEEEAPVGATPAPHAERRRRAQTRSALMACLRLEAMTAGCSAGVRGRSRRRNHRVTASPLLTCDPLVTYPHAIVDEEAFRALSHPARREILDRLFEDDGQTLSQIEGRFEMTRFGVMKHLRVLEEAGLIVTRKVGREKLHYLNPVPIRAIHDRWIGKFAAGASEALLGLRSSLEGGGAMNVEAKPSHVFMVFIRTTPEQLWEAITSSEFTQQYYYGSTVESDWRAGSPYVYRIGGDDQIVGEVIESDPPRRLVSTFDARWDQEVAADPPSTISWEIEPAGSGVCKLTVVHEGLAPDSATASQVDGGMPFILSGLKSLLETGKPLMPAPANQNA
jgi:uncharacterized protein YndB with AHSA1/START domain/DNA-binding transcriptional ArsR family regulator